MPDNNLLSFKLNAHKKQFFLNLVDFFFYTKMLNIENFLRHPTFLPRHLTIFLKCQKYSCYK